MVETSLLCDIGWHKTENKKYVSHRPTCQVTFKAINKILNVNVKYAIESIIEFYIKKCEDDINNIDRLFNSYDCYDEKVDRILKFWERHYKPKDKDESCGMVISSNDEIVGIDELPSPEQNPDVFGVL